MSSKLDALNKLAEGSYGTEGETLDWSYWDTAVMAAAALVWRMFTAPIGGVAARTRADTNMTTSGMIPQAQYFEVYAIKFFYLTAANHAADAQQDLFTLIGRSTMDIRLTNKFNSGEWGLDEITGLSIKYGITHAAANAGETMPNTRFHCIYPLKNKIILAAMTPFEVNLLHHMAAVPASLVGDFLKISLAGILTRAT